MVCGMKVRRGASTRVAVLTLMTRASFVGPREIGNTSGTVKHYWPSVKIKYHIFLRGSAVGKWQTLDATLLRIETSKKQKVARDSWRAEQDLIVGDRKPADILCTGGPLHGEYRELSSDGRLVLEEGETRHLYQTLMFGERGARYAYAGVLDGQGASK